MSCSKPLPLFTYDVLCYLNRDQLERITIVCRPLKNLIERYFRSKPYRIFDRLEIRIGWYALFHKFNVQWHPNREDYSVQQFLAGQICSIDESEYDLDVHAFYSFDEMRPYLGPTVRIKWTNIDVNGDRTYNPEEVEQMESLAHLWRDGKISIWNSANNLRLIRAEDFQPILNSPTILQCRILEMDNAHFSFKDYKILYTVKVIETVFYFEDEIGLWLQYYQQFLEQPGVKPVIVFFHLHREIVDNLLNQLSKDFFSAVSTNTFKIVFSQRNEPLTVFREVNKNLGEKFELKKGLPTDHQDEYLEGRNNYTLERSSI